MGFHWTKLLYARNETLQKDQLGWGVHSPLNSTFRGPKPHNKEKEKIHNGAA